MVSYYIPRADINNPEIQAQLFRPSYSGPAIQAIERQVTGYLYLNLVARYSVMMAENYWRDDIMITDK